MAVKVSVVVPVYNPGQYIEPCIESLLSQSLPARELELLFVNDGSTDDSGERLEAYAAAHLQVKVLTIPNSGWPGKPRNVGTDAAAGEYVMFVDQDDQLEPESLQRMYELGAANAADVVLGKVISDFRGVNHALYRRSRPHCTVYTANLMNSLTPHKMLRTAFLREHSIRYPEGPRRLEDQLFMTKAYFAATAASIVADYVCYRYLRRPDGKNAGSKRIVPAEYYGNLGEVLDVVDTYTEPGEVRDGFYRRFLRTEMLGRLDARGLLDVPEPYPTDLLAEVGGMLADRFPLSVDAGLGAALRCRVALTREGSLEEIVTQAESIRGIHLDTAVTTVKLSDGAFQVEVEATLTHDGAPLRLEPGGKPGWLLPAAVTGPAASPDQRRVEDPAQMSGDLIVKHRDLADEWMLPSALTATIEPVGDGGRVVFRGTAVLDPRHAAGGRSLRKGLHDLYVRVEAFGLTRNGRLNAGRAREVPPPILVDDRQQIHRLYATAHDKLSINVDALPKWRDQALASAALAEVSADRIVLDLGVLWAVPPRAVTLTVSPDEKQKMSWTLRPEDSGSTRWHAPASIQQFRLPLGEHPARVKVAGAQKDDAVKVALGTAFPVTAHLRRGWLRASLRQVPGRGLRYLRRLGARRPDSRS